MAASATAGGAFVVDGSRWNCPQILRFIDTATATLPTALTSRSISGDCAAASALGAETYVAENTDAAHESSR